MKISTLTTTKMRIKKKHNLQPKFLQCTPNNLWPSRQPLYFINPYPCILRITLKAFHFPLAGNFIFFLTGLSVGILALVDGLFKFSSGLMFADFWWFLCLVILCLSPIFRPPENFRLKLSNLFLQFYQVGSTNLHWKPAPVPDWS